MSLWRRSIAEMCGTLWLVLGGCGSAVLAAGFPHLGIGFVGVALAFGLTVLTGAYALGPVSGAHFNPAVSVGLWLGGRFPGREVPVYAAAQVVGGLVAGAILYAIASGAPGFHASAGFASNGYGAHSPGGYALPAAALCEVVMTGGFLLVIMGATDARRAPQGFAPIAIGLALTLIHLVSIPVTNTSVNPARSTGVAFYAGGWALRQLWLFWLAPLVGGALGGLAYRALVEPGRFAAHRARSTEPPPGGIIPGPTGARHEARGEGR
jgi:aquaporin Z